ncbi:MAG: hypothetical protein LBH25_13975 [Fibromonadaceae bacterium]|jgi:hypothetical protein|nr:hypothetical protein [Fibromonadaceae bacterium]
MKISIKVLAYATVAYSFLACNNIGTDPNSSSNDLSSCASLRKTYISYDVYDGPNDPTLVIIVGDVKEWMDEQLASGSKEQKYIWISMSDLPLLMNPIEQPVVSGTYNSATGETKFVVNGKEMTLEEHKEFMNAWEKEYIKYKEDIINSYMSSVFIPGEEVEIRHGGWKALMTAENIVELTENNEGLAISFYAEPPYEPTMPPVYEFGNSTGDAWIATETAKPYCNYP